MGLDRTAGLQLTLSGRPLQVPDDVEIAGALGAEGQQDELQECGQHCDAQEQGPQRGGAQHGLQAQHLWERGQVTQLCYLTLEAPSFNEWILLCPTPNTCPGQSRVTWAIRMPMTMAS